MSPHNKCVGVDITAEAGDKGLCSAHPTKTGSCVTQKNSELSYAFAHLHATTCIYSFIYIFRYDRYTPALGLYRYSSSVLKDPFIPRSSLGKLSSSVLDDPFVPRSSVGKLSSSVLNDPSVSRTGLPKLGEMGSHTSYQTPVPSIRYGGSLGSKSLLDPTVDRIPGRPQVKFDPFTGQPYKFDPFTGEPIQHETSRSGSLI